MPFHTIHLDHLGPLPALQSKRKHLLVVVDAFTKFVKLYPVVATSTKEVCAALEKYFGYYSRPSRIVSDRGTCFTSNEFSSFLKDHNIDHVKVAVTSPQANGQVERENRVITPILSKLSEPLQHADWVKNLSQVEYALNNSVHRSIGVTPSKVLFGVDQRGESVDRLTEFLEEKEVNPIDRNFSNIRAEASESIQRVQAYNLKQFLEHNKAPRTYEVGDAVTL